MQGKTGVKEEEVEKEMYLLGRGEIRGRGVKEKRDGKKQRKVKYIREGNAPL